MARTARRLSGPDRVEPPKHYFFESLHRCRVLQRLEIEAWPLVELLLGELYAFDRIESAQEFKSETWIGERVLSSHPVEIDGNQVVSTAARLQLYSESYRSDYLENKVQPFLYFDLPA